MKLALALAVLVGFVAASPTTPTGLPGLQRRQTEACATACTAPITEFQRCLPLAPPECSPGAFPQFSMQTSLMAHQAEACGCVCSPELFNALVDCATCLDDAGDDAGQAIVDGFRDATLAICNASQSSSGSGSSGSASSTSSGSSSSMSSGSSSNSGSLSSMSRSSGSSTSSGLSSRSITSSGRSTVTTYITSTARCTQSACQPTCTQPSCKPTKPPNSGANKLSGAGVALGAVALAFFA